MLCEPVDCFLDDVSDRLAVVVRIDPEIVLGVHLLYEVIHRFDHVVLGDLRKDQPRLPSELLLAESVGYP